MKLSRTQNRLAVLAFTLGLGLGATTVASSAASSLPAGCEKVRGTITCTTTESPGKNQGGVGSTTTNQTQGNTTNKSPEESQDLANNECGQRPAKSNGSFSC